MCTTGRSTHPSRWTAQTRRGWLTWGLILWLPLAGAACSGSGRSADDDSPIQASADEDESYPNLSRVPGEQPRPTPESLRKELIEGLAADRANARYTGELLTAKSAAPPPAAPPPAAQPQVEIIWETLRVLPEGETETVEEVEAQDANATTGEPEAAAEEPDASVGETEAAAEEPDPSVGEPEAETAEEEVRINWETERVEPSGKVAVAGVTESEEELILAPPPELLAVVYFPQDSTQVDGGDRQLLEEVVALYKERGGRLRLVGHASGQAETDDQVAQRMANLELSLERANAVATTLLDLGADKEELLVEAKAESQGDDGEVPVGGGNGNRKVEIFLEP